MDKQTRNLFFHEVESGNLRLPVIGRKTLVQSFTNMMSFTHCGDMKRLDISTLYILLTGKFFQTDFKE